MVIRLLLDQKQVIPINQITLGTYLKIFKFFNINIMEK